MEQAVELDYLGGEGYMACLELQRFAVRVRVVDDVSFIAGSLKPDIDLVVARHGGFPMIGEQRTVHIVVMENTELMMEVSQSICEGRGRASSMANPVSSLL
jgi:hypothetical protein